MTCQRAGDRMMAALDRLGRLVEKANFNPEQPRLPPGPGGGQWVFVEGYAREDDSDASVILAASPGIGHNGGPRLDQPPEIPPKPPQDRASQLAKAKEAAKWLAAFGARRSPAVAAVLGAIGAAEWLRSEWPSIQSYRDAPRTMEELIGRAREARPGYHRHHIVEQTPAERDGFPRSLIDGVENVVSVPVYRHREISAWYQTGNPEFGNLSPREYLRGKDWSERARVGRLALRKFEVLKP
jgi:hypothetical protein